MQAFEAGDGWARRVLVTGGAGFIGSRFVRLLRRARPRWLVVNLDLLTYAAGLGNLEELWGGPAGGIGPGGAGELPAVGDFPYGGEREGPDPGHRLVRGDIADSGLLEKLFARFRFDYVVNFAAESHVDRSILDAAPFVRTNIEGARRLLEAARRFGVERFVQVSTDEVYGDREGLEPADEGTALSPGSPYAASKAAADLMALAYHRTYGVPVMITRSSNNYGPGQFPEKLIPLMIWKAAAGEPLPVYGDGGQVRDWLFVDDNAEAILAVLERGKVGRIYNIGAGDERRNLDVVLALCDLVAARLGRPAEAVRALVTHVRDRPGHDRRYAMRTERVREETGWAPATPFEAGLATTVDWYLARLDRIRRVLDGEYRRYYEAVYRRGWDPQATPGAGSPEALGRRPAAEAVSGAEGVRA